MEEKRGDLLNQLAIIVDLMERANIHAENSTIVFGLNQQEFVKTYNYVNSKQGGKMKVPTNTFTIRMGTIDIIFNKSSV